MSDLQFGRGRGSQQQSEQEVFKIQRAVRQRVPQIMCIYGPTFSGKTFGAFLVAAGLVEPGGKIGLLDSENKRGSAYADDPDIMKVIPQGFDIIDLAPPFHPRRYIGGIRTFENAGFDLAIIDSGSHAWDGEGGAQDIKEKEKGWAGAKMWSKRLKNAIIYSQMHIIVCLRAQNKVKIVEEYDQRGNKKQKYIPLGMQPICEATLPFDLGVSIRVEGMVDGQPATHLAYPEKYPKGMGWLFDNWNPQLLTPDIGRRIREWNDGGSAMDPAELLQKQARNAAEQGVEEYAKFYLGLPNAKKKVLSDTTHNENKEIAKRVDEATAYAEATEPAGFKQPSDGAELTEEEMQRDMLAALKREQERESKS